MPNPAQTDLMIARLEAANARSYERARKDGTAATSEQDAASPASAASDKKDLRRQSSLWAKLIALAIVGLAVVTSAYVTVGKSLDSEAAKLIVARWAHATGLQAAPEPPLQDAVSPQRLVSPEIEERLQKILDEVRDLKQRIEQLKVGQDLFRRSNADVVEKLAASSDQMARDNAKVVEQLDAILTQMARQNSAVAEQLKATQDQLADLEWSRPAKLTHKRVRKRPVSILPPAQKLAQAQSRLR